MRIGVVVLLLLAQSVIGGTASDPEISDPSGDPETSAGTPACGPAGCAAAPQFIDLTRAWVDEETATDLVLAISIAGNHNANAYGEARFVAQFNVGGTDYTAGLAAGRSGTTGGDDSMTLLGIASQATFEADHVRVVVPLEAMGSPLAGDVLTDFYVATELDFADEDSSTFTDRAPDSGAGNDYVFVGQGGAEAPAVNTTFLNLDAPDLAQNHDDATSGIWQYNWTQTDNETVLHIQANATVGAMELNIAAGNETILSAVVSDQSPLNETLDLSCAATCLVTFHYNLTGFVGAYSVAPVDATVGGSAEGTGNAIGNTTQEDTNAGTVGEESPAPWLPFLVALAAAAWFRRR